MQVFTSWSGGKDSCLACYEAIMSGLRVSHLLNMTTEDGKRSCWHGLRAELIEAQSQAIGIPVVQRNTPMQAYEREFRSAVHELRNLGVEGGVFGDIDLEEHRGWVEAVCNKTNIRPFLPLWGRDQTQILERFIGLGFKAVIVAVNAELFGEEWIGRELDCAFLAHLANLRERVNLSVGGEAGEYHTLVVDGPLFKKRIEILASSKVERNGYFFLDIAESRLRPKSPR
jgi:diphthine-ammonia ligase